MKICVIGAGAIGGLVAAHLARAGETVSVIDVGEHLAAIQKHGLKIIAPDGSEDAVTAIEASDSYEQPGPQDLVVLAVKTNVLSKVAPRLDPLREVIMWRLQYRNFGLYETLVGNFVTDVNGIILLDRDEHMRPDTTMQSLAGLTASFEQMGELAGFDAVAMQRYPEIEFIRHVHHASAAAVGEDRRFGDGVDGQGEGKASHVSVSRW